MRYRITEDPFKDKQPKQEFIKELTRPVHEKKSLGFNKRAAKDTELKLSAVNLNFTFPDPENLLDTIYDDFKLFLKVFEIPLSPDGITILTAYSAIGKKEGYKIEVTENSVRILSEDTEGIRRALIFIEDEMQRRDGAFLQKGVIERFPFITTRISRCYFTPPSHNDNQGMVNELDSDIDYYPEEYLNRLMHDGINGLWIGSNFRDLVKTDIIPEHGEGAEKRIKKLNATIERCRKYGIKIYLFVIEPASTYRNDALKNHPELLGAMGYPDVYLFCPSNPKCEEYINQAVEKLFTAVPNLAGLIDITAGEALSGCGSHKLFRCPKCKEKFKTHGATLAATEKMLADAVKRVKPDAEFISWTYAQRGWNDDELIDTCAHRDKNVIHMQNFEDMLIVNQLGKERLAMDYWLAQVGPGKTMRLSLEENTKRKIKTYAKIQACSSHEISSVPYIPVPGILYEKYKFMREHGISGVLQCWYLGNYPGLMNKAACELSFEPFIPDKKQFLIHLAGIYWGKNAEIAANAFIELENSYRNFPVSCSAPWLGPFHDSPVCPLHLKPVDLVMPSTWMVVQMVGSDRIGDCLLDGHSIEEAAELSRLMTEYWKKGANIFSEIDDNDGYAHFEQQSVSKAIDVLLRSAHNVIEFYRLRRLLGIGKGGIEILNQMQKIVRDEMDLSAALVPLCEKDSRLGYHSEAFGYKFFKEKLLWRIAELKKLLDTEFNEVRERLNNNLPPLTFYLGEEDNARVCKIAKDKGSSKPLYFVNADGSIDQNTCVTACEKGGVINLEFTAKDADENIRFDIMPEFRMFHLSAPFSFSRFGLSFPENPQQSFFGKRIEERKQAIKLDYKKLDDRVVFNLSLDKAKLNMDENEVFRLGISRVDGKPSTIGIADRVFVRLVLGRFSPDSFAFFINE
ncbi:MAG: hypothetical protein E7346_01555 [Clostridiales bacterium]|nr:hypothetical protein [Clostridiales bacterium]